MVFAWSALMGQWLGNRGASAESVQWGGKFHRRCAPEQRSTSFIVFTQKFDKISHDCTLCHCLFHTTIERTFRDIKALHKLLTTASSLPSCRAGVTILEAGKASRCAGIADLFEASILDVIKSLGEAALDAKLGQLLPILKGHGHRDRAVLLSDDHWFALHGVQVASELLARDGCGHGFHTHRPCA